MANITHKTGDIFTTTMPAFGHGVNVYGVMGSGIAVAAKNLCPDIFDEYREACLNKTLKPGGMLPIYSEVNGRWVLNLASQDKPGRNATYGWLGSSVIEAFEFVKANNLEGFALPRIGAGIGGLEWENVSLVLELIAANYPEIKLEVWSLPGA